MQDWQKRGNKIEEKLDFHDSFRGGNLKKKIPPKGTFCVQKGLQIMKTWKYLCVCM